MTTVPYELERTDGGFAVVQPVTGLRVEGSDVCALLAAMHQAMLDRRNELSGRAPGTLDDRERRELEHLAAYTEAFLRAGPRFLEPTTSGRSGASASCTRSGATRQPYEITRPAGGPCILDDPASGLRVEHPDLTVAIDRMHRLMLQRRAELEARDPADLTPDEQRALDHLRACPEGYLRAGLLSAGLAA